MLLPHNRRGTESRYLSELRRARDDNDTIRSLYLVICGIPNHLCIDNSWRLRYGLLRGYCPRLVCGSGMHQVKGRSKALLIRDLPGAFLPRIGGPLREFIPTLFYNVSGTEDTGRSSYHGFETGFVEGERYSIGIQTPE